MDLFSFASSFEVGDQVEYGIYEAEIISIEGADVYGIRLLHSYEKSIVQSDSLSFIRRNPKFSPEVTAIIELLYDLNKTPNINKTEIDRLLIWFNMLTGRDKPRFM